MRIQPKDENKVLLNQNQYNGSPSENQFGWHRVWEIFVGFYAMIGWNYSAFDDTQRIIEVEEFQYLYDIDCDAVSKALLSILKFQKSGARKNAKLSILTALSLRCFEYAAKVLGF